MAEWLEADQLESWRSLQMMQLRLYAYLARDLAAHSDLSHQDYMVLVALTDRPEGRARLFELSRLLGWEKSRLSHHVSRMVERGLVRKHSCPMDRRGAYVEVTGPGRQSLEKAAPGHVAAVRRVFVEPLRPEQFGQLADICRRVLAAVEQVEAPQCDGE